MADWLDIANAADLEAVARSLREGRLVQPYPSSAVHNAGFGEASAWLADLADTPPRFVALMLDRLARQRRESDARYASVAQLVWSGDMADLQPSRDTEMALAELFARAERHILIATYVIVNGKDLFEPLAARLRERPCVQVELYVNLLPDDCKAGLSERDAVRHFLEVFRQHNWPEGAAMPAIYYHPSNLHPKWSERVTLHAKCVVVDHRWSMVTSANFTEAAQGKNLEAAVLLDHPGIAQALAARLRGLRECGRLKRMGVWEGVEGR